MLLSLLFPLATLAAADPVAAPAVVSPDPPVRVSLNNDGRFIRGDAVKLKVRSGNDGYLIVLRTTTQGRVRVLFPLDPTDDNFVRGNKTYEVRGRGDREAFRADDSDGSGTVLAAVSPDPLRFDEFVRGDHWDFRVLGESRGKDDDERVLLDLVDRMAAGSHYEYDLTQYQVYSRADYADYRGYDYRPSYYDPYYNPWPCFGCGPYYGSSFSIFIGFGHDHYRGPYRWGYGWYDPWDAYWYSGCCYSPIIVYDTYYEPWWWYSRHYYGYPRTFYRNPRHNRPPYTYAYDGYGYGRGYTFKPRTPGDGTPVGYRPRAIVSRDLRGAAFDPVRNVSDRRRTPESGFVTGPRDARESRTVRPSDPSRAPRVDESGRRSSGRAESGRDQGQTSQPRREERRLSDTPSIDQGRPSDGPRRGLEPVERGGRGGEFDQPRSTESLRESPDRYDVPDRGRNDPPADTYRGNSDRGRRGIEPSGGSDRSGDGRSVDPGRAEPRREPRGADRPDAPTYQPPPRRDPGPDRGSQPTYRPPQMRGGGGGGSSGSAPRPSSGGGGRRRT